MTANDPDTDRNGLVTYSLESLPNDTTVDIVKVFSIDGERGWITTVQETDCESTRLYKFNVVATDHGGDTKLSSSVLVEVSVTDENDNPPKFSDDVYRGSVVESSSPGEVIVSMTTTDADVSLENRLVTCYITGVYVQTSVGMCVGVYGFVLMNVSLCVCFCVFRRLCR